jgi:polyhydroxyalkanoate synthesis regulator phasin
MKRTIDQSILAVEKNLGSVFTKEDVIELLKNIEQETNITDEQKENIVTDIMQNIEYAEDSIVDKESVRLEIDSSNYVTINRVDIEFNVIRQAVQDIIFNLD